LTLLKSPTRVTAVAVTLRSLLSLALITVLPTLAHSAPTSHLPSPVKKLASVEPKQPKIVAAAFSLRGTRYRFGGTSRSGFDCSGFVRYVLGTGGVDLPRTATDQYYNGKPIDKAQLEPGDLVFFKNTYKRGISHVGIYAGNGNFIHACNPSRGVVESSLSESYYVNHWAGARRVLAAVAQRLPTSGRW